MSRKLAVQLTALSKSIAVALVLASPLASATELAESFIGVRFVKSYDSFYMVMVDEKERPYLTPKQISDWIHTDLVCDKVCTIDLADTSETYIFDYTNKNVRNNGEVIPLGDGLIVSDEQMWIRYDLWEKVLPLYMSWTLSTYQLSFHPGFKLPSQIIYQYETDRKGAIEASNEKKRIDRLELLEPAPSYSGHAKVDFTTSITKKGNTSSSIMFNGVSEISGGTLMVNANYEIDEADSDSSWQYEKFNNRYAEYFSLGDTYSSGTLLLDPLLMTNGIKVERNYDRIGTGEFSIKENTAPLSTIDVYHNGFFIRTIESDLLGQYVVDNLNAKSGDIISLRELSPKGELNEKIVQVTGDSSAFLTNGDFDFKIQASPETNELFSSFKYGAFNNVTVGYSSYESYDESHDAITVALRPIPQLSMLFEGSSDIKAYKLSSVVGEHALSASYTQFPDYLNSTTDSILSAEGESSLGLSHRWAVPFAQVNTEYSMIDEDESIYSEVLYRLSRDYTIKIHGEHEWNESSNGNNYGITGTHHFSSKGYSELSHESISDINYYRFNFKYTGNTNSPWSSNLSDSPYVFISQVSYSEGDLSWQAGLDWNHNEYISGSFSVDNEGYLIQLRLSLAGGVNRNVSENAFSLAPYEYSSGSLSGRVLTESFDGEGIPIAGAKVIASSRTAITDDNGYYLVKNLPTNSEIITYVDPNSVDVTIDASEAKKRINLRATTNIETNFSLPMLVGIDGMADPKFAKLILQEQRSGKKFDTKIESDGFFVIENIKPSTYNILYIGKDGVEISTEQTVIVNKDTDWISGLKI